MKLQKLAAGARAFSSLHFRKGPGIEVAPCSLLMLGCPGIVCELDGNIRFVKLSYDTDTDLL